MACEMRENIEKLLDKIDDARLRVIIRYKYIDGMEWNDIAAKMGHGATVGSLKMYSKRYLKIIL